MAQKEMFVVDKMYLDEMWFKWMLVMWGIIFIIQIIVYVSLCKLQDNFMPTNMCSKFLSKSKNLLRWKSTTLSVSFNYVMGCECVKSGSYIARILLRVLV